MLMLNMEFISLMRQDFCNINNIFSLLLAFVKISKILPHSWNKFHILCQSIEYPIYMFVSIIYMSLLARYRDVKDSGIYIYIFFVNSCTFAVRQNHQDVKQWMRVVHITWSRDQPYLWPPVSSSCVSYHRK